MIQISSRLAKTALAIKPIPPAKSTSMITVLKRLVGWK